MDCSTSDGGLRLGGRSGLCRSRSRLRLWTGIHPAASRDGHSRPTNCTAIALAERLCRTPDWLDQAGGTRSRRRAWRASPSARTAILHGISQPGPHAFVAEQRRADSTRSSRRRSDLRKASSWWSASPIRSDLIYDRDSLRKPQKRVRARYSFRHSRPDRGYSAHATYKRRDDHHRNGRRPKMPQRRTNETCRICTGT
jgi:hypothetical protein